MTLRDHQPDVRFQGDGLARGLHEAMGSVSCLSRAIRTEIAYIRRAELDHHQRRAAVGREWVKDAWAMRRQRQQSVVAYRGLIQERDAQRALAG